MKALQGVIAEAIEATEWRYDDAEFEREEKRAATRARRALLDEASPAIALEDLEMLARGTEESTPAMHIVKTWWQRLMLPTAAVRRRMLVLLGGTGCGKTVGAAWALTREPGRYVTTERLLLIARSRRPEHLAEYDAVLRTRVLVLDEAGAEHDTVAIRAIVLDVLNRRQAGQYTIITSNLNAVAFRAWLDERALSRLMQGGHVQVVAGADMRLRTAAGT